MEPSCLMVGANVGPRQQPLHAAPTDVADGPPPDGVLAHLFDGAVGRAIVLRGHRLAGTAMISSPIAPPNYGGRPGRGRSANLFNRCCRKRLRPTPGAITKLSIAGLAGYLSASRAPPSIESMLKELPS